MKKSVMLASLLALALAVSPLGGMGMRVSAEEGAPTGAEIRTVSGGNNSELEDRKLPTPTNPRREGNFVVFDYDGRQPGGWETEVERNFHDGLYVDVISSYQFPWNDLYLRDDNTDGSDTYYVPNPPIDKLFVGDETSLRIRVRALDFFNDVNNSEWSEWSESWIRKEQQETVEFYPAEEAAFRNNYRGEFACLSSARNGTSVFYEMILEKDGEVLWSIDGIYGHIYGGVASLDFPLAQHMEDTGSYQWRVRVRCEDGQRASEWRSSPVVEYTRPEQALGTTVGQWDEESIGVLHYPSVEGAAGYQWRLYKWNEESNQWEPKNQYWEDGTWTENGWAYDDVKYYSPIDVGGEDKIRDFSYEIGWYGPGRYCAVVKALSRNIDEVANGPVGEMSNVLEISSGNSEEGSSNQSSSNGTSTLESQITAAVSGTTVKITKDQNICSLPNSIMKQLLERGDVALEMEYTYEGVDFEILIPAGAAMDNDIPWYGPLYLAQYYSVNNAQTAEGIVHVVRRGDTFSKIARANGMTTAQLAAKNPQIKNISFIYPGQIIYIK